MTTDEVEREVVLSSPVGEVWEALTDPGRLGEWFGAEVEGDVVLEPGEVVVFRSTDGTARRALVESVRAPERLVFRWLPGELPGSRVEIDCMPSDGGTVVRVVETRREAAVNPTPTIGFRPLARV